MKKILITGSNGFIGKHLCTYFKMQGLYLIGLGRSNSSASCTDEYICCDLGSDDVEEIIRTQNIKPDCIVHLATDSRKGEHFVESVKANCVGTQKLLTMCTNLKIPDFIQLSSLPIIGKPKILPITEEHPLDPPTVYHTTKVTQEFLAKYAEKTFGLRTCSFRLASPIGKNMNPKTIFSVFLGHALKNEPITVYGKGSRKQTYIYIDDVSEALYHAVVGEAHGIFNLTSKILISNKDLAYTIKQVTGSSSDIVFEGDDYMDDYVWQTDILRLENILGFSPRYSSIEEIIKIMSDK